MSPKLSQPNQSVEKTLAIIELMSTRGKMRLQDIAALAEIPVSTALRLVNTLLQHNYVIQDSETLRYSLSMKFAHIGSLIVAQTDLHRIARPMLVELSERCEESCCIGIEEDRQVVYIDVVDGPDGMLKITQRIGKRAPMHCSGIGKVLLLNRTPAQLTEFVADCGLQVFTEKTIATREALTEELQRIATQGYALDDEECELGVKCVAAPVRDYTGKVIAGISASGPVHRMSGAHFETIKKALQDTAARISKEMGYYD